MSKLFAIISLVFVFCVELKANDFYNEVKNSRDFTGKVVLITGSDSGIGKETAKLFSALGAKIVVTGRKAELVHSAALEVQSVSSKGVKPLEVVADLTKHEEVEHLFNQTILEFGQLDVLVNDAGIFQFDPITDPKFMEKFELNLNIDVKPALQLIKLSIPTLERTKGSIVNIASIVTKIPQRKMVNQAVAKTALKVITEVLAQELGPSGIRINTVSPGSIESHGPSNFTEAIVAKTPLRRIGEPGDVAKGIAFLASTDASFITGANLVIDGGLSYNMGGSFIAGEA